MKTLTILLILFSFTTVSAQEKNSFLKSIKFTALGIGEFGSQWKPFQREEDKWHNLPPDQRREEDRPHGFVSYGLDLQLNYMIDGASFVGLGYQHQQFVDQDIIGPMNTYYLHFRTGDDFDSKYCLFVELDLGGCYMQNNMEGIMYRATVGIDFNGLKIPQITPTVNLYMGQRVLSNISTVKNSGGFYTMFGASIGMRIH
ncbi:hypothetical protein [Flammeovirga aprica]|uniref:Outer membrane protein beta-barrel domain-containing protein n=1 Tax=Flammeovirga aprica JL-4 TaxID=694437 RepID=A0A7X9RWI9_9BACT|nr:hypothetical protein [Flammeovirga aprica]NME69924.1 hypothetical protein [Flammeovirga aprica JL-4]